LAKLGCIVVVWDMNMTGAEETAASIRKMGGTAYAYKVDVTNREMVYDIANRVATEVGQVTMLFNNAGIVSGKKIFDPENSDAYMEKTVQVNTISHFWTVKAFLPAMIAKNHGHLITIASSAGLVGVNGLADYCASKFGELSLSLFFFFARNNFPKVLLVSTNPSVPSYTRWGSMA
jgi:all-trans-retinol dehydrogenase (NAD+)